MGYLYIGQNVECQDQATINHVLHNSIFHLRIFYLALLPERRSITESKENARQKWRATKTNVSDSSGKMASRVESPPETWRLRFLRNDKSFECETLLRPVSRSEGQFESNTLLRMHRWKSFKREDGVRINWWGRRLPDESFVRPLPTGKPVRTFITRYSRRRNSDNIFSSCMQFIANSSIVARCVTVACFHLYNVLWTETFARVQLCTIYYSTYSNSGNPRGNPRVLIKTEINMKYYLQLLRKKRTALFRDSSRLPRIAFSRDCGRDRKLTENCARRSFSNTVEINLSGLTNLWADHKAVTNNLFNYNSHGAP